ncbi:MAG: fasciclin domain-containing protein [Bacteroidota bacterium]
MPTSRLLLALLLLSFVAGSGCDSDDDEDLSPATEADLAEVVVATPTYTTLETVLNATDLLGALADDEMQEFTLFAPGDSAFIRLDEATAVDPDADGFTGLVSALLVPDNAGVLTEVLTYHVVPQRVMAADLSNGQTLETLQGATLTVRQVGADFFVDGSRITAADVTATNGILHRIDRTLTGPADVVGLVSLGPNFSELETALGDAGLVEALQEAGPFTVFAPTNAAFPNDAPTGDDLSNILRYHVVPGRVFAADLSDGLTAATLQGQNVTFTFTANADTVFVNDAQIIATDLVGTNGIVHVIDGVLLPE